MPKLAYTGPSHFRQISKADLVRAGVDKDTDGLEAISLARQDIDPGDNPKNLSHEVDVPDAVADLLLKREPHDWKLASESSSKAAAAPDGGDSGDGDHPGVTIRDSGDEPVHGTGAGSTAGASSAKARGGRS